MDSHPTDTIGMPMTGQSQERRVVRLAHGAVVVDHATLLDGIDFELAPQAVTGLVGPNGAGKSTLLKVLARQQALTSGACFVDGLAYASLGSREFSRRVGYLPQSIPSTPAMTVDELVCLGRFPWHGALGRFTDSDRAAVDATIKAYRAYARKVPLPESALGYTMDHSSFIYLYGPDGAFVTAFDPGAAPEKLAADLQQNVK